VFTGEDAWFGDMVVGFVWRQSEGAVDAIRLYDADGNQIETDIVASGEGLGEFSMELSLPHELSTADIEVDYWKDMERVSVEFDITTDLSLEASG
jgi:hypothetical protein